MNFGVINVNGTGRQTAQSAGVLVI